MDGGAGGAMAWRGKRQPEKFAVVGLAGKYFPCLFVQLTDIPRRPNGTALSQKALFTVGHPNSSRAFTTKPLGMTTPQCSEISSSTG